MLILKCISFQMRWLACVQPGIVALFFFRAKSRQALWYLFLKSDCAFQNPLMRFDVVIFFPTHPVFIQQPFVNVVTVIVILLKYLVVIPWVFGARARVCGLQRFWVDAEIPIPILVSLLDPFSKIVNVKVDNFKLLQLIAVRGKSLTGYWAKTVSGGWRGMLLVVIVVVVLEKYLLL